MYFAHLSPQLFSFVFISFDSQKHLKASLLSSLWPVALDHGKVVVIGGNYLGNGFVLRRMALSCQLLSLLLSGLILEKYVNMFL